MNTVQPSQSFNLRVGSLVFNGNSRYTITAVLDIDEVTARSATTGNTERFKLNELSAMPADDSGEDVFPAKELLKISDDKWIDAHRKSQLFDEILNADRKDKTQKIEDVATELSVSVPTVYLHLRAYKDSLSPLALLRKNRSDKGKGRFSNEVEELLQQAIDQFFLTQQKINVKALYDKFVLLLREHMQNPGNQDKTIKIPHINTVRNRVADLTASQKAHKRDGKKGKEAFRPLIHRVQGATMPLQSVQIDHTILDIVLVDEENRLPIGRPTLTIAICEHSRVITGFYLSFEKPSATLLACCISHSVLDKTQWLKEHGVEGEWKVKGLMSEVKTDNGKEFRSNALIRACDKHKINLSWRPVKTPRYGGQVERIFGTINQELHQLPGTTKSNVQQRSEYDSEKEARLTLFELETWLTEFIVNVYHKRVHSSLNMTPIQKYTIGILGDETTPGRGLPPMPANTKEFIIDFLPYQERTVQRQGLQIHGIHYFHDTLRRWIKQPDKNRKETQKFIVRYDPRDLSKVYFYDPEIEAYCSVPYRNTSYPPISLWEFKQIKKKLQENNPYPVNEEEVFEAKARMQKLIDQAQAKTKSTRMEKQKEQIRQRNASKSIQDPLNGLIPDLEDDIDFEDLTPYEE